VKHWWVLVPVIFAIGCGSLTSNNRYVRTRIRMSPICTLTLIHDRRTGYCLASYSCSILKEDTDNLVIVPKELCEP